MSKKKNQALKKYLDDSFHGLIIRPATVCGFSPRMRYDVTVNALTYSGITLPYPHRPINLPDKASICLLLSDTSLTIAPQRRYPPPHSF